MSIDRFLSISSLIIAIISIIFNIGYYTGAYTNKIDSLENEFNQSENYYKEMNKKVSILWHDFTKNDKKIVRYYDLANTKNVPLSKQSKAIELIKTIEPNLGIEYLIKNQGFNQSEAHSIFESSSPKTNHRKDK